MPDPDGYTRWPFDSGFGDSDRSNFIRYVDVREPEVNEVWSLGEEIKFIPQRELTSTLESFANLQLTTSLKMGLRPLYSEKIPLMEVLSFSALLVH